MLKRLRPRLTFANVASALALFVALATGGAYAANEWNGSNIQDGTLTGADIQDLSLGLPDYGANSISTGKLKDGDVRTQDLRDLGVTNSKIAWDSVSSGKVINNNLTGDDINESTLANVLRGPVTMRSGTSVGVPHGQVREVVGTCDPGTELVGGGVIWSQIATREMRVLESYPSFVDARTWKASVSNESGTDKSAAVRVICAYITP
jgi:hypothetical protein